MNFGEIKSFEGDGDKSVETTVKVHDGQVRLEKREYKERVQIMLVTDLDTIIEEMHVKHAFDQAHGAWIEKSGDKLYAVKYYATLVEPSNK